MTPDRRRFGHIPDLDRDVALDLKRRHASTLVGAALPADTVNYASHAGEPFDQMGTSSCGGNAVAKSIYTYCILAGHPVPEVSRGGLYAVGRLIDDPYRPLRDEGVRPTAVLIGGEEFGITDEASWPLTEETINDPPPLDVFTTGANRLVLDRFRIPSGNGCSVDIRAALARRVLPCFCMPVDLAYMRYRGDDVYSGLTGDERGLHYQVVVGCVPGALLVLGSWGSSFGEDGIARIADSFFDSGAATDILCPVAIPGKARP